MPIVSFVNERKFSSFGEQAIMDRTTVETLAKQQLVMSIYDNFEIPGENFEDLNDSCIMVRCCTTASIFPR